MFTNPFASFHDSVSQAKEEREQLGQLLTISTPAERLLVVLICITVIALAAWLFLGKVTPTIAVDGMLSLSNESTQPTPTLTKPTVYAKSVWLTQDKVRRIQPGLEAVIEVVTSDNSKLTINGTVAKIASANDNPELHSAQIPGKFALYSVHIESSSQISISAIQDASCRIFIHLNPEAPITHFRLK